MQTQQGNFNFDSCPNFIHLTETLVINIVRVVWTLKPNANLAGPPNYGYDI